MALPDLSGLQLHEDSPPVSIGADDYDSDDDMPLSKRAARFDMANPDLFKQPKTECETRRPRKTLVAKLLQHRGSNQDAWGKGAFDSQLPFLEAVQFLRQNTTYPTIHKEIENLRNIIDKLSKGQPPDNQVQVVEKFVTEASPEMLKKLNEANKLKNGLKYLKE